MKFKYVSAKKLRTVLKKPMEIDQNDHKYDSNIFR